MSPEADAVAAPHVRRLSRWNVPFHYVVPVVVALVGLLLLAAGGVVAVLGGWWLAVALPIAIGAFLRDARFALVPAAVWLVWLMVAALAGSDSGVAHTPVGIAVAMAVVGGVATLVTQYAIFPATAREAWEPAVHRITHPGENGGGVVAGMDGEHADEDAAVDPEPAALIEDPQMTVSMDAIAPITTQERDALEIEVAESGIDVNDATVAEAPRSAEVREAVQAADAAADEETPLLETLPDAEDDTSTAAEHSESAAPVPDTSSAEHKPLPEVEHVELPLDADPTPLDEGGHPLEFRAITEEDLLEAESADTVDSADQPGSDVP